VAARVLRSERRAYAEARYRAGSPAKALAHPGLQNQYVVPSCSTRRRARGDGTVSRPDLPPV